MKSKKIMAALLSAVVASSLFIGCSKSNDNATKDEPSKTEDKLDKDQTISVVGYDYKTLDPNLISDAESFTTLTNVYEGLMKEVTVNGVTKNDFAGAEKMDVSSDKLVYTFTLRKDAKWSDGKPVTAQQYVYSWKRISDPRTAADYFTFLADMKVKGAQAIVDYSDGLGENDKIDDAKVDGLLANLGVAAKDDNTFVVTLEAPNAYFESALSFKCLVPVRDDLVKAQGKDFGTDFSKMAYNGAFTVSEYAKGSKIVYSKNANYWDVKNVKIDKAVGNIIDEPTTLYKMFDNKELDVVGASGDDLARYKQKADAKEIQYYHTLDTSAYFEYYNVNRGILKSPKVRLALSLALNRQEYLDVVYKRNVASFGLIPSSISMSGKNYRDTVAEPLKNVKDDPKTLYADGLKDLNVDPSKAEVTILFGPATTVSKASGEYLQNVIQKALGVKVNLNYSADSQTYFKERQAGNFDLVAGGWGADYNDPNTFFSVFLSSNPNNNGKYKSDEYDKLVAQAAATDDAAKRADIYKQAETLLVVKDAAVMPTFYADINQFRQNYVKNFYVPKFGGYYDLSTCYISGKQE